MFTSRASDNWNHASYTVRVRAKTYLWGSAGITVDAAFANPLILHIRNDIFGELITVYTEAAAGTQTKYGTLGAGECLSIPVQGIIGVFAECTLESAVACLIREHA